MEPTSKKNKIFVGVLVFVTILILVSVVTKQKKEVPMPTDRVSQELMFQTQVAEIVKSKDLGKCSDVQDPLYVTVCTNNIALTLAQEQNDIAYCARLDDKLVSRAQCEQQVVSQKSVQKEDVSVCKESSFAEVVKRCEESFYTALSVMKGDVTVCLQAGDKAKQDMCHDQVIVSGSKNNGMVDPSKLTCGNLYTPDAQVDCKLFKDLTLAQPSPEAVVSFCGKQKTNFFQEVCVTYAGINPNLSGNSIR